MSGEKKRNFSKGRRASFTALAFFCLLFVLTHGNAFAQSGSPVEALGSPLAGLAAPRGGAAKHEGSWDRKGGNDDARAIAPGETLTLLDAKGAGIIRRFWATIAPRSEKSLHRQAILRMYWDGETTPSVEVPIGDFFGVGFGEQRDYISLPMSETSGGYNCYWPMPYHKSARWTLTNLSSRRLDAFYYNIDYTAYPKIDKNLRHFHAQWRRENPTSKNRNYTILEATGAGHYVGTALFMQNRHGHSFSFLEGDEMIYANGETAPSVNGTGTEDYFSSGWYFDRGLYSAPFHGVTILDRDAGRVSAYRWHIEDAIPFTKSLKVTIEHGNQNDTEADYSSVAYWYQTEPHAPFPALPSDPAAFLAYTPPPPLHIAGAIEGESLAAGAAASQGTVSAQDMAGFPGGWSGDAQLWWRPTEVGATLELTLNAPADGTYNLTGYFTKAKDYGKMQVSIAGKNSGPELDLYAPEVTPSGPLNLGQIALKQGQNKLLFTITGKNALSTNYLVGLDALVLKK